MHSGTMAPGSDGRGIVHSQSPVLRIIVENLFYPVTLEVLQQVLHTLFNHSVAPPLSLHQWGVVVCRSSVSSAQCWRSLLLPGTISFRLCCSSVMPCMLSTPRLWVTHTHTLVENWGGSGPTIICFLFLQIRFGQIGSWAYVLRCMKKNKPSCFSVSGWSEHLQRLLHAEDRFLQTECTECEVQQRQEPRFHKSRPADWRTGSHRCLQWESPHTSPHILSFHSSFQRVLVCFRCSTPSLWSISFSTHISTHRWEDKHCVPVKHQPTFTSAVKCCCNSFNAAAEVGQPQAILLL